MGIYLIINLWKSCSWVGYATSHRRELQNEAVRDELFKQSVLCGVEMRDSGDTGDTLR